MPWVSLQFVHLLPQQSFYFCINGYSPGVPRQQDSNSDSAPCNVVNLAFDIALITVAEMGLARAAIAATTAEWTSAWLFPTCHECKASIDGQGAMEQESR